MKKIECAGQTFVLTPSGILVWPSQKTAIVSDLHLEKASYFAARGQMLPPHESFETLQKLWSSLQISKIEKIILLGDSFHDKHGFYRLNQKAQDLFEKLCCSFEVIWVLGNHDDGFVPDLTHGVHEVTVDNITFRHEAEYSHFDGFEVSGHYHPKASLKWRGARITRPCFIGDKHRLILPSFGTFTGGLDIQSDVIARFFNTNFTAHLLGEDKIYSVPADKFMN